MKRLMTLMLVALLSLGIASISVAQEGAAAGAQPGASQTPHHKGKKHKKKGAHKGSKKKKGAAPAAEEMK